MPVSNPSPKCHFSNSYVAEESLYKIFYLSALVDGMVADIYISTYCDLKRGRSARGGGTVAYVPSLQLQ